MVVSTHDRVPHLESAPSAALRARAVAVATAAAAATAEAAAGFGEVGTNHSTEASAALLGEFALLLVVQLLQRSAFLVNRGRGILELQLKLSGGMR